MKKLLYFPLLLVAGSALAQVTNPLLSQPAGGTGRAAETSPIKPIKADDLRSVMFPMGMAFVGGRTHLRLSSEKVEYTDRTTKTPTLSFGVAPHAGYYVADNIAVGGGFMYDYSRTTYKGTQGRPDTKSTESDFGVGLFGRYSNSCGSIFDCCHRLGYFFDLGAGISTGKESSTGDDGEGGTVENTTKRNSFRAGVTPGVVWFPTPRLGLEASVGSLLQFSTTKVKPSDDDFYNRPTTTTSFELFNLSTMGLSLGLNYYLMAGQ